ncbi:MAG: PorT family protein, partial [Muribaculaceae bacterium]|nr:PorT family protein [Muribaculaceae bacterium]
MMRSLLLALALAATLFTASAQTHYEGNIAVGAKGGVTLSRLKFSPSVPQTMLPGFMAGVTFRYIEEKHFGVIAELNLEQRGWKEKFDGLNYAYQRRLTYLQLPMLTHIFFGNNKVRGFFNAGPEIGLLIGTGTKANFDYANVELIEGFPTENRETDQYKLDVKNKFDYGISAGLGLEVIGRNKHSFTLEGRFYYGLRDVFSNHSTDPFSSSSSMSIMVTLGYYYRI